MKAHSAHAPGDNHESLLLISDRIEDSVGMESLSARAFPAPVRYASRPPRERLEAESG